MQCAAQCKFCSRKDFSKTNLCANRFYTSTAFTQALLLHKPCFYTKAFLHKTCFYTSAVFTQALSLHKHCFYTSPAFTQKRFYTSPPFTQVLSLHKLCLYTSIAFIQALLLHNDICSHKPSATCKQARLDGRQNAEGCKIKKNLGHGTGCKSLIFHETAFRQTSLNASPQRAADSTRFREHLFARFLPQTFRKVMSYFFLFLVLKWGEVLTM